MSIVFPPRFAASEERSRRSRRMGGVRTAANHFRFPTPHLPHPRPVPRRDGRRAFLSGRSAVDAVRDGVDALLDRGEPGEPGPPAAGPTVRLSQRAMACEFAVVLNPGPDQTAAGGTAAADAVSHASDALALVSEIEDRLSAYRPDSEVSRLNRHPAGEPFATSPELFALLAECETLRERDRRGVRRGGRRGGRVMASLPGREPPADGRRARRRRHAPPATGAGRGSVHRDAGGRRGAGRSGGGRQGVRAGPGGGPAGRGGTSTSSCCTAGRSSVLARGGHRGHAGWPVGLGNPHRPTRRLGTLLLGDAVGRDPGDGHQRVERAVLPARRGGGTGTSSTPAPAGRPRGCCARSSPPPTATEADALSTAFFVLGVERAADCCDNHPPIGAVLVPEPADPGSANAADGPLRVTVRGLTPDRLFLDPEQAAA